MGIEKLAVVAAKKPWITLGLWILLIGISGFLISTYLSGALTTRQTISLDTESAKAADLLSSRVGSANRPTELIIIKSDKYKIADPAFQSFTLNLQNNLMSLGKGVVEGSFSFYQTQNPAFVSKNQDAILITTSLAGSLTEAEKNVGKVREVVTNADKEANFSVYQSGAASVNKDFQDLAEKDLSKAEFLGIPIALVVLILVFGALGAATLPMVLSFLAIGLALAAVVILGHFFKLSFFVTNMITMMGLAVGIDYSLFIVSRFREEKAKGLVKLEAIAASAKTASRAIFFSGVTVIVALAGLLFLPSNIFRSLSIGAIFVVTAAVFAALTLLPALLSLLDNKVNFLSLPFFGKTSLPEMQNKGFWHAVANVVMRFPWAGLLFSAGLLIIIAIPIFAIKIGSAGVSSLPKDLPSKAAFQILEDDFSSGLLSPTKIVIDGDVTSQKVQDSILSLQSGLAGTGVVVGSSVQTYADKKLAEVDAILAPEINGEDAIKEIRSINALKNFPSGTNVYVGGHDAENYDFTQIVKNYTPIVFGFVLSLSFLFLMVVFRSLVVPFKAIVMNLLSVGAAYGAMVLVFQKGLGASLLGFQRSDSIESWIPLFLFAVLFGLSMDYHVFLLSRIREHFNQTGDNTKSVAFGLATTGRLITGAALIMVAVFAAFAAGSLVMFQQVGFGLAVAIFLDVTIVRSILVPSTMKLLGNLNWYLPSWLSWLPHIGIES